MQRMLLAICALAVLVTFAVAGDEFGIGGRPWFGWWDANIISIRPYILEVAPRTNGAAWRGGLRGGDTIDLRRQPLISRIATTYQLLATKPTALIVRRGTSTIALSILGSTVWDDATFWKLQPMVSRLLANMWFVFCGTLIVLRRGTEREARAVAVMILCLVGTMLDPSFFVVPWAAAALTLFLLSRVFVGAVAWLSVYRTRVAPLAYAVILAAFGADVCAAFGLATTRIDPLPFILSLSPLRSALDVTMWLIVLLVASTSTRSRWLTVPVPAGLLVSSLCFATPSFVHNWIANVAIVGVANAAVPLGVLFVTYAVCKRQPNAEAHWMVTGTSIVRPSSLT